MRSVKDGEMKILGFAGSLRKGSYNRALLREASKLAPEGTTVEIFELDGIPPYNDDLLKSMPQKVKKFKEKIKAADAILFVTPEYNHSVSGVIKNAIDWASRPYGDNSFDDKPASIMSASTGMLGGARAQYHLRQSFVFLNVHPINAPQVFITHAADKFDKDGRLLDEKAKELIKQQLSALVDWAKRLKGND